MDVWDILPYRDQFILLNVASWQQTGAPAADIVLLAPNDPPVLKTRQIGAAPLWGVIHNDNLYTYHNPTWNQTNETPQRMLSRHNLVTGDTTSWPLPDGWGAEDLSMIADQLLLAVWESNQEEADGLYRFDPRTGKLQQVIAIPDAARIISVHE
jgi:hypothetical protein